jgi:UDP-3-O-acyl N-acetylglucosamine deacetylase
LRQQRTIARPVSVAGFGYWSGQDVRVEMRPAPPDTGLVFVRSDLASPVRIAAHVAHRIETPRRTTLVAGGAGVEMVEHVLAACAGLHIDNCELWVDARELPGCDGSSQPFVDVLLEAGIVQQGAMRKTLVVARPIRVGDRESWVEASPLAVSVDALSLEYHLDFPAQEGIGRQCCRLDVTPQSFVRELARARTFLLEAEAQWLQQQGLGHRVSPRDVLIFGQHGVVGNELRFADECVRHKMLDLVGDLALAGCDIAARIVAHRSGHRLNAELVRALLSEGQLSSRQRRTA